MATAGCHLTVALSLVLLQALNGSRPIDHVPPNALEPDVEVALVQENYTGSASMLGDHEKGTKCCWMPSSSRACFSYKQTIIGIGYDERNCNNYQKDLKREYEDEWLEVVNKNSSKIMCKEDTPLCEGTVEFPKPSEEQCRAALQTVPLQIPAPLKHMIDTKGSKMFPHMTDKCLNIIAREFWGTDQGFDYFSSKVRCFGGMVNFVNIFKDVEKLYQSAGDAVMTAAGEAPEKKQSLAQGRYCLNMFSSDARKFSSWFKMSEFHFEAVD
eukprot:gnl/TRDRNA2_/TRDRNA2_181881_c0_seq1.p1 gnl/TRDRNA2_/TRDRNA2_181881_c0~~gnl/TRDRNA2_/TRDRNA2_181881_c0_seq1.p1  ORF type:complete len:269 (-),score=46.11 gnl/TRDRNA2_/TRDRNA2_181881_c0_seq1:84-890(-)